MSNLQQFYNLSSWRKETLSISAHEVEVLDFLDTTPNMFYIINPTLSTLKVGIGSIPRTNSYEYKIEANSSEIVGRPEGSTKLYILNDSSLETTITVFSINKEFDPAILKNMNVVLEGYDIHTGSEILGIAEGLVMPTEEKNSSDIKTVLADEIAGMLTEILENLSNVQEVNSEQILRRLISMDSILEAMGEGDCSLDMLWEKLNTIAANTAKKMEIHADNIEAIAYDDTDLRADIDDLHTLIHEIQKDVKFFKLINTHKLMGPHLYYNNVVDFTCNADIDCSIHFDWLFNDGGLANVKINDEIVLTMLEGEKFRDIEFRLFEGDVITIDSDKPMYRIKYYLIEETEVSDTE